jgi:hypothetical protein
MNEVNVKHVVMYSGGAGSAWVGKYVADKFGKENTILLHTDTKWEDEDNYRFMNECAEYIGVPITYKTDGRTPEDIFREKLYFGNFGTAPCSKQLKMFMTFEFIQELFAKGIKPILYFGIDYNEVRRAPRIAYNYKHNVDVFEDGLEVRFPLIGEIDGLPVNGEQLLYGTDYLNSDKMPRMYNDMVFECLAKQNFVKCSVDPKKVIAEEWGIKLPRMYELGFQHANCGGRCIKAGKAHFANLYRVWPERYAEVERMEREINEAQLAKNGRRYTILSKTVDGKKVPYSLEEYRKQELEANECQLSLFDDDTPCECAF